MKSHDLFGAYLCSGCHRWLDEGPATKADKVEMFTYAMARSHLKLIEKGLLKVA